VQFAHGSSTQSLVAKEQEQIIGYRHA